jgi:hypothetical protein
MSTHKSINEETLNNLLYLSRLSPESTNISILKKQVDDIVGYFEILSKTYLSSIRYPESDLLETLQMERSCFYDRKKEAVLAFGLAMWGTIIPRMQAAIDCPD